MKNNIRTNYGRLYSEKDLGTLVWLLQHWLHYVNVIALSNLTGNEEDIPRLYKEGLIDWYPDYKTGNWNVHLTELGKEVAISYALYTNIEFTEYDLDRLPPGV